eukprot:SAG31_NODE_1584_length_7827_cov_2.129788_3_plen_93_part_00
MDLRTQRLCGRTKGTPATHTSHRWTSLALGCCSQKGGPQVSMARQVQPLYGAFPVQRAHQKERQAVAAFPHLVRVLPTVWTELPTRPTLLNL